MGLGNVEGVVDQLFAHPGAQRGLAKQAGLVVNRLIHDIPCVNARIIAIDDECDLLFNEVSCCRGARKLKIIDPLRRILLPVP